jgi:hypothetical protein
LLAEYHHNEMMMKLAAEQERNMQSKYQQSPVHPQQSPYQGPDQAAIHQEAQRRIAAEEQA